MEVGQVGFHVDKDVKLVKNVPKRTEVCICSNTQYVELHVNTFVYALLYCKTEWIICFLDLQEIGEDKV